MPGFTSPQTVLVSRECCHVARTMPAAATVGSALLSNGLGLKKWVVIFLVIVAEQGGHPQALISHCRRAAEALSSPSKGSARRETI